MSRDLDATEAIWASRDSAISWFVGPVGRRPVGPPYAVAVASPYACRQARACSACSASSGV